MGPPAPFALTAELSDWSMSEAQQRRISRKLTCVDLDKVIEKSKTMMVTWACCAHFTQAMKYPEREIVMQTRTVPKIYQLIEYCDLALRMRIS
jgi:hypothetical protein